MKYDIKQLSLGQILDQAITLMKNHFGAYIGVVAVTLLPFGLLQQGVHLAIMPRLPPVLTFEDFLAFQAAQMEHFPLLMGMVLLTFLVLPIVNASLIHMIANTYLGNTTSVGSSIGSAFAQIIPLYWTSFLVLAAFMGGWVFCLIPGIIMALLFSLATQVVVVERISGVAALQRSRELMRGNMITAFVLGFLILCITFGVQIGAAFIPQIHASAIASVLISCVMTSFSSAATVVFYFSCRCMHEQFDLQLLAQNVGIADTDPASDDDPFAVGDNPFAADDNPYAADD